MCRCSLADGCSDERIVTLRGVGNAEVVALISWALVCVNSFVPQFVQKGHFPSFNSPQSGQRNALVNAPPHAPQNRNCSGNSRLHCVQYFISMAQQLRLRPINRSHFVKVLCFSWQRAQLLGADLWIPFDRVQGEDRLMAYSSSGKFYHSLRFLLSNNYYSNCLRGRGVSHMLKVAGEENVSGLRDEVL